MTRDTREIRLYEAFAALADTLVADYDVVDLLQSLVETCQNVLDVAAAGILLADGTGELEVIASTSEESRLVETMQIGAQAGPCIESYRTASVVTVDDLTALPDTWRDFRDSALELGFASACAIPMRLRETTIGSLNLLRTERGALDDGDVRAAQALADVATIGILHERTIREVDATRDQLQHALNTRIVIEQAKGVLAHTHKVSMDDAFALLRGYARSNRLGLTAVAEQLVNRTLIF